MPHVPTMEYNVDQGRQGRFIIRSCFGGADCTFIAAGSEVPASFPVQTLLPSGMPGPNSSRVQQLQFHFSPQGTWAARFHVAQS